MLSTDLNASPDAKLREEADAELAAVYGGNGVESQHFYSKWYCSGIWPFRRISFECPGCRRWLSVAAAHSARIGFCPSCDLTVSAPDLAADLPPALVSSAKEIPALPARRLPDSRTVPDTEEATSKPSRGKSGHAPGLTRFVGTPEEAKWGIGDDHSLVPIRVVTRLQSIAPWLGLATLIGAAALACYAFIAMQKEPAAVEIAPDSELDARPKVPLGSELWVVLDSLSTAESPEELLSLVRNPDELRPQLTAYYKDKGNEVVLPHHFERASPGVKVYELGDRRFARFEGRCDGRPVKFTFEATEHGWRLDWESLVGYNATDWSTYLKARPAGDYQFRLLGSVSTDELIDYEREEYVCLQFTDHLETATGFALVKRYGRTEAKLGKFLELSSQARGVKARTWMTPVLRAIEGSDELLEMVDLRSGSWLIP
jgi:hypothetical protein